MTTTFKGTIALNDKTQNHVGTLRHLGYNVSADDKTINVPCNGFHTEDVNFNGVDQAKESCAKLISDGKLWTMSTKFHLPGRDKPLFGFPLLRVLTNSSALKSALGFDPSALIVKTPRKPKAARVSYPEGVSSRKDKRAWIASQLGIKPDGLSLKVLREKFLNKDKAPVETVAPRAAVDDVSSLDLAINSLRSQYAPSPFQVV